MPPPHLSRHRPRGKRARHDSSEPEPTSTTSPADARGRIAQERTSDDRHIPADIGRGPKLYRAANGHDVAADLAKHVDGAADVDHVTRDDFTRRHRDAPAHLELPAISEAILASPSV